MIYDFKNNIVINTNIYKIIYLRGRLEICCLRWFQMPYGD